MEKKEKGVYYSFSPRTKAFSLCPPRLIMRGGTFATKSSQQVTRPFFPFSVGGLHPTGFLFTIMVLISLGRLVVPINTAAILCTDIGSALQG